MHVKGNLLKNKFSNLLPIRDRPSTLTSYSICDLFIRHVLHLLICKFDIILLSLAVLTLLYKRIKCSRRQRLFSTSAKFMSVGVYLSLTDPSVTACATNLLNGWVRECEAHTYTTTHMHTHAHAHTKHTPTHRHGYVYIHDTYASGVVRDPLPPGKRDLAALF